MKNYLPASTVILVIWLIVSFINHVYSQSYCAPNLKNGCSIGGDSISYFQFGTYIDQPGCKTASIKGYDTSKVSSSVLTVYRGKTYPFQIRAINSVQLSAWIDYNKNGSFDDSGECVGIGSYKNATVTIPINASPQATRLRIMSLSYNAGDLNNTGECNMYPLINFSSSSGAVYDYKITIAAYQNDLGIINVNSPQILTCPSSKTQVQVLLANYGTNYASHFPVVLTYGTTSISTTYNRTLAPTKTDTFTVGYLNASSPGTYKFTIYVNLSGDSDHTNDTINETIKFIQPSAPKVEVTNHCGPVSGFYLHGASVTSGTSTFWFKNNNTDTIFAKGDSLPISYLPSGSVTLYAESRFPDTAHITKGAGFASSKSANGATGLMFDITPKRTVTIDSFAQNMGSNGGIAYVDIYYRLGSYRGVETNSSEWIHVGTSSVKPYYFSSPSTLVPPIGKSVTLQPGNTYGFYLYCYTAGFLCDTSSILAKISNGDLNITTGCGTESLFGGIITPISDWDGSIYYHFPICNSTRVASTINIIQGTAGASLNKGLPFQGQYKTGDINLPDNICTGDTNSYQIIPPKGLLNSDYGTKWVISDIKVSTVAGFISNDTIFIPTKGTTNGLVRFFPSKYGDSIFILKMHIKIVGGTCDSVMLRYIHVWENPIANFGFKNQCLGTPISFSDSSKLSL